MRNIYIILILIFTLLAISGCTSAEVIKLKEELEKGFNEREDFSGTYVKIGFNGEEISRYKIVRKNNGNIYTKYEDSIVSDDGINHFLYKPAINKIYLSESKLDPEENSDINNLLLSLLGKKGAKVKVKDSLYQEKPVHKVHISYQDTDKIYFVEKNTYLVIRVDELFNKKTCNTINKFLKEELNQIKDNCISSSFYLEDYKINQNIENDFFDLRNSAAEDVSIVDASTVPPECTWGTPSACEDKNRRLEEASFDVKLPTDLPEGFYISFPPEQFPEQDPTVPCPNPCYESYRLSSYSNVYDDVHGIPGASFEVIDIKFKFNTSSELYKDMMSEMEDIVHSRGIGKVQTSPGRFLRPPSFSQSTSPFFLLSLLKAESFMGEQTQTIEINGVEVNVYYREGGDYSIFWTDETGITYSIHGDNEEYMIKIARSLE